MVKKMVKHRRPALQDDQPGGTRDYYDALHRSDSASDEPVYVISVVADMVGVHAQTLRHYERVGLVVPARSNGNIRLYSEKDVERLTAIVRLTNELGLNLAGVEAILKLRRRIDELQREVDELEAELRAWRGYLLEDRRARGA
jgi:MerR family transcriptional regulator/heat shock protein HspR